MLRNNLKEEVQRLCRQLNIIPVRSKGQNFLVNEGVLQEIIKAADLKKEDAVLEIGPGLGILTAELVKTVEKVVAVELDKKLFTWLKKRFNDAKNLELVEGDIVSLLHCFIIPLFNGERYKVVANLPYQITSHILRLLLEADNPPEEMVLMVQKEVGERICAKQGDMSLLSVMVQYYGVPEIARVVARDNFWPRPEVDSVIMHIKSRNQKNKKSKKQEDLFFNFVRAGFSGKRKMLKNNLRNIYKEEEVMRAMEAVGLDLKARAEDLGVEEWMELYQKLRSAESTGNIRTQEQKTINKEQGS